MRRLYVGALVLCGGTAICGNVWAEPLTDALVSAYTTNPQLEARRATARATDEAVNQQLAAWRPNVSLSGDVGRGRFRYANASSAVRNPRDLTFTVSQPLFNGFTTYYGVKQAEADVRAEWANLQNTEQAVLVDAATAYTTVARDQAVLALNINNEQVLQRQLDATRDRFRVGEITRTDVAQAEAALAQAKAERRKAEGSLETSRATFLRVVGRAPENPEIPPPIANLPETLDDAIALARGDNPSVVASKYGERSAQHNIDRVRGGLLPTVSLDGTAGRGWETSNGVPRIDTVEAQIRVSVPIYQQGTTYSRLREAKHNAGRRRFDVDSTTREVTQAATSSWETLQAARASIVSLKAQVSFAEIALDGVQREAQVGSRTVLDVLNQEQDLLEARVNLVTAQANEAIESFNLMRAAGRFTAEGLDLPVERYDPRRHYEEIRNKWIGSSGAAEADANLPQPSPPGKFE